MKDNGNLMIGRVIGETLSIGSDIEITVSAIRGKQVRLHVSAPKDVRVGRKNNANGREWSGNEATTTRK